jgi:hypothetical protein
VHEHGFDERSVIESMESFLGLTSVGQADLGVRDRVEAEIARERIPQRGRQRPDQAWIRHAAVLPDGVADLPGAIRGLALGGDPGRKLVLCEARDPGPWLGRHPTMLAPTIDGRPRR